MDLAVLPDGQASRLWVTAVVALSRRARAAGRPLVVVNPPEAMVGVLQRVGVVVVPRTGPGPGRCCLSRLDVRDGVRCACGADGR